MGERRRNSILFPLVLIALGMGLLLDRMGIWAFQWSSLWRLWPLLLIVIGLDMILRSTRWGGALSALLAVGLVAAAVIWLGSMGATTPAMQREQWSHPLDDADSAQVRLEVHTGRLSVSALPRQRDRLIEVEARYDGSRTAWQRGAEIVGRRARVSLATSSLQPLVGPLEDDRIDEWSVSLSPRVPIALEVQSGVGRSTLDLRDLQLLRLDLRRGVGEVEITLPSEGDYTAHLGGGVGRLSLELPAGAEARIRISGGIGDVDVDRRFRYDGEAYTTPSYDRAQERAEIMIEGGIGSIIIR